MLTCRYTSLVTSKSLYPSVLGLLGFQAETMQSHSRLCIDSASRGMPQDLVLTLAALGLPDPKGRQI